MQMKPHKQVHRGKGQHSFPLGEKRHSEDTGFIVCENTQLWCVCGSERGILCLFDSSRYAIKNTWVCVCWSVGVLLLSLLPSLETALCQLHSAKCHSVFPLPWKHLPLQCLPAEEYTHTHTKAGRLKSTYSLLGNRVWVSVWPPPLL